MPIELENKAMWAMKKLKMDRNETVEQRLNGLNEIDQNLIHSNYTSLKKYKWS